METSVLPTLDSDIANGLLPATKIPQWALTKKYRSLWARRIGNFAALKNHLRTQTAFFSIDVKSCPGSITEVGMAHLPSFSHQRPTGIKEFAEEQNVKFGCLTFRQRKEPRMERENFKWSSKEETSIHEVNADSAEGNVIEFFGRIKELSGLEHIIVIGFTMNAEFNAIFDQMPALIPHISAWIDIQPIIYEVDRITGASTTCVHCHLYNDQCQQ
ncbi:hypothetical protein GGR57DRAFT_508720 [Xylariaceae sp. FL1272]|nr:hypothetical protein GGR57DRAFT_508720 [Xylariaceae sp. FL1272]